MIGRPGRRALPGNHQPFRGIVAAASTSCGVQGQGRGHVALAGHPQGASYRVHVLAAHLGDLMDPQPRKRGQHDHHPRAPVHAQREQVM
ncbi:hypothetical protein [Mycobacterium riyadhense]|uniref:hypothetical protein n=1 Tax=Mycobacterium riyadhense TaxID=486698 RepID=UPI001EF9D040|nr:hypothetical protein [Mycobacterium riyadhense]